MLEKSRELLLVEIWQGPSASVHLFNRKLRDLSITAIIWQHVTCEQDSLTHGNDIDPTQHVFKWCIFHTDGYEYVGRVHDGVLNVKIVKSDTQHPPEYIKQINKWRSSTVHCHWGTLCLQYRSCCLTLGMYLSHWEQLDMMVLCWPQFELLTPQMDWEICCGC